MKRVYCFAYFELENMNRTAIILRYKYKKGVFWFKFYGRGSKFKGNFQSKYNLQVRKIFKVAGFVCRGWHLLPRPNS